MSSETIDYYNQNAADFVLATDQIDMTALYGEFLPLVKPGGHILDAGCGSGRDASYFKQLGFTVSAFDASKEMARIASEHLQQTVAVHTFEQLSEAEAFDGIWCCASLLHVASENLPQVFCRLQQALKPGAVLYTSFKYGDTEREVNGRRFTDLDELRLTHLLSQLPELCELKSWRSCDQRPDRTNEFWLNVLIWKKSA